MNDIIKLVSPLGRTWTDDKGKSMFETPLALDNWFWKLLTTEVDGATPFKMTGWDGP